MDTLTVYGFDIVPGIQGSEIAYEADLANAVAEADSHRKMLEDDPELTYMLPLPPSEIYKITLRQPTAEFLASALNDPSRLSALLEISRETVATVGLANAE